MGEAGVGKSRLLYKFRKAVANEEVTFFEGKCLSYGRGVAYHPIIDILKASFRIEDQESDSDINEKVKRGLSLLGADEPSTLPYLLELLSVKESGIDKISMSPEAKKDRIIGALRRIILKGAEHRPLIYAFEDLHWMDRSSEEAAKYLMESIPGARVLMIFTCRPEFVHTWGGKSFHSQVTLNRLSNRESLTMVGDLLGSDNIAPDLQDLILEKTEGVPFFIEEFARSLKDMGIIERTNYTYHLPKEMDQVTIPSTIQDVIMARVDSLADAAKEVLQAGSAIEREFGYELIKTVAELPEQELLSRLSVLKDAELLHERGIFPQSTFVFKHALTRDVVYDSILGKRRKLLHEKTGNAIEKIYHDSLSEHYGVLLEHFHAGDEYEKGAKYAKLATKKAEKRASLNDAISYTEKGIACLERLPVNDETQKKIIDARTMLGLYLNQMGNFRKAKEIVDPITESAIEGGYIKRLAQIYIIVGSCNLWIEEDLSRAVENFDRVLELSEQSGDLISAVLASFYSAHIAAHDCRFQEGSSYIERAINTSLAVKNLWGISVNKSTLSSFQMLHGQAEVSYRTSIEALKIAEQSGDIFSKAWTHVCAGFSCLGRGAFGEAKEKLSKGVSLGQRINQSPMTSTGQFILIQAHLEIGEYQIAKNICQTCIELLNSTKYLPSMSNMVRASLEKANILSGEKNIELERLRSYVRNNRLRIYEGWTRPGRNAFYYQRRTLPGSATLD